MTPSFEHNDMVLEKALNSLKSVESNRKEQGTFIYRDCAGL